MQPINSAKLYQVELRRTIHRPGFMMGHTPEPEEQNFAVVVSASNADEARFAAKRIAQWPQCASGVRYLGTVSYEHYLSVD